MVTVSVDIDAEYVLRELDDADLVQELERRGTGNAPDPSRAHELLEAIWMHYRDKPDVPQCLRDYMWLALGKVL